MVQVLKKHKTKDFHWELDLEAVTAIGADCVHTEDDTMSLKWCDVLDSSPWPYRSR